MIGEGGFCTAKFMTKMRQQWVVWQATPDCSALRKRYSLYQEPGSMRITDGPRFLTLGLFVNLPDARRKCLRRAGPSVGIHRVHLPRLAPVFLQSPSDT